MARVCGLDLHRREITFDALGAAVRVVCRDAACRCHARTSSLPRVGAPVGSTSSTPSPWSDHGDPASPGPPRTPSCAAA